MGRRRKPPGDRRADSRRDSFADLQEFLSALEARDDVFLRSVLDDLRGASVDELVEEMMEVVSPDVEESEVREFCRALIDRSAEGTERGAGDGDLPSLPFGGGARDGRSGASSERDGGAEIIPFPGARSGEDAPLPELPADGVDRSDPGDVSEPETIGDDELTLRPTLAQRRALAELMPDLEERLALRATGVRSVRLRRTEAAIAEMRVREALGEEPTGRLRRTLECLWRRILPLTSELQFRVTLVGCDPPVWRRIRVPDGSLLDFHELLQAAMGWTGTHLWQFRLPGVTVAGPEVLDSGDEVDGEDLLDAGHISLREFVDHAEMLHELTGDDDGLVDDRDLELSGSTGGVPWFVYEYDFGDGWLHLVEFEGIAAPDPGCPAPVCLDGAGACPPEDVGGVYGYAELLDALSDPRHERHEELREWIGRDIDPLAFSAEDATIVMRHV